MMTNTQTVCDRVQQCVTVCNSVTSKEKHTNTPTLTPNPDTGGEDRLGCHCEDWATPTHYTVHFFTRCQRHSFTSCSKNREKQGTWKYFIASISFSSLISLSLLFTVYVCMNICMCMFIHKHHEIIFMCNVVLFVFFIICVRCIKEYWWFPSCLLVWLRQGLSAQ